MRMTQNGILGDSVGSRGQEPLETARRRVSFTSLSLATAPARPAVRGALPPASPLLRVFPR